MLLNVIHNVPAKKKQILATIRLSPVYRLIGEFALFRGRFSESIHVRTSFAPFKKSDPYAIQHPNFSLISNVIAIDKIPESFTLKQFPWHNGKFPNIESLVPGYQALHAVY